MINLSKQFYDDVDYLSKGYKLAFNREKKEFSFCKPGGKDIIDTINSKTIPIFDDIEQYRCFRKKVKDKAFDPFFQPRADQLKKSIWAVHAARVLPKQGILSPYIANVNGSPEEIAGISNTIHFALGELVRPHGKNSWENHSIAVLTPLSGIINQTVNIFAHDTFINGPWKIAEEAIILVLTEPIFQAWRGEKLFFSIKLKRI